MFLTFVVLEISLPLACALVSMSVVFTGTAILSDENLGGGITVLRMYRTWAR
jgi:hypothetical protein